MLDDTARKLLRVMVQFKGHVLRMPTLEELRRMSGRRSGAIKAGMQQLVEQHYIDWDENLPVESATVIEAWERDVPIKNAEESPTKPQHRTAGNTNYWTDY